MTLSIYRASGKIIRVHALGEERDYYAEIAGFRKKNKDNNLTVSIEIFDDDSVVAYLYALAEGNKRDSHDGLPDIPSWIFERLT